LSLRDLRAWFAPRKTETRSLPPRIFPSGPTFSGSHPFCLTHTRGNRTRIYRNVQTSSFLLATSPRYHFQTCSRSSSDRSFPHHIILSLDAYLRRGYFSMEDSTSICYTLANTLPGCRAIRTRMHYAHPQFAGLDGYIRDCDLRYRKLLSKARPKTRGGCIKFLNSGMTATRRRCLPSLLQTRGCMKRIPSSDLPGKQVIPVKCGKVDFILTKCREERHFPSINCDFRESFNFGTIFTYFIENNILNIIKSYIHKLSFKLYFYKIYSFINYTYKSSFRNTSLII